MIEVNLLPEEMRQVTRSPVPYLVAGLVSVAALVVMAGLLVKTSAAMGREEDRLADWNGKLDAQLAQYDKEETGYDNIVEEHNALEQEKIDLADKIDIIREIVSDRIIWSRQLWLLSKLTPDNIWFGGIKVATRTFKDTVVEYDERKKTNVTKTVPVKRPVLEIHGYVVPDENGNTWIDPLTNATQNDPEFSNMFEVRDWKLDYVDFNGYPVRSFELEYLIKTGEWSE